MTRPAEIHVCVCVCVHRYLRECDEADSSDCSEHERGDQHDDGGKDTRAKEGDGAQPATETPHTHHAITHTSCHHGYYTCIKHNTVVF